MVRTFGCQMNEHDSERLAGLLAEQGMQATDDVESADVVVAELVPAVVDWNREHLGELNGHPLEDGRSRERRVHADLG